jgi:hypothetical protein
MKGWRAPHRLASSVAGESVTTGPSCNQEHRADDSHHRGDPPHHEDATMFARLSRSKDRQIASSGRARRRRPTLESLEGRQLLSLGAELPGTVNTTTRNAQFNSDSATNAGGESVVVWTDTFSSTDHDIRAQRYNSFGGKLGPEIVVSFSSLDEDHAKVAIDGTGRFEVTWTQQVGNDSNVVAQRFDSNGNAIGGVIQVANSSQREYDPAIATDLLGDFVISYTHDFSSTDQDIAYKEYNSSGTLIVFNNPANSTVSETHSSVGISEFGLVDVAWEQAFSANDHDVYMSRYSSTGQFLGRNTISFSSLYDQTPSVSMDNAGDAVVAWEQNNDIVAMRVSSTGAQGPQISIANSSNIEFGPSVAMRRDGGGFVVTYESLTSTSARAKVAEVSAFNSVTTFDAGTNSGQSVSIDGFGDYFISSTGNELDIHARRGFLFS